MEDQCHMIIIYVALIVPGLCNYSMNTNLNTNYKCEYKFEYKDLTNLCNKRVRYDHHGKNYKRSIIEGKTIDGTEFFQNSSESTRISFNV